MKKITERKANRFITKRLVFLILLLVSFTMTSNSFAYWSSSIGGTTSSSSFTFRLGAVNFLDFDFSLDSDEDTYGYVIELDNLLDDPENYTNEVSYSINWDDITLSDELLEGISTGTIDVTYTIKITRDGKDLRKNAYARYSKLIDLEVDEDNPDSITYGESETLNFSVSLTEENRRNDYRNLAKDEVSIVVTFTVNPD